MQQNAEDSTDSTIMDQMNIYFSFLRKQTGKCPVPSKIDDEIHQIIFLSTQSANPISFLQKIGLVLFDKCCGVNLNLLSKKIFSCKSRISECFRREGWASSFTDDKIYKKYLHEIFLNDSRFWSLREYPPGSTVLQSIAKYPQVVKIKQEPVVQVERKIEECQFELTLQKDIFSWTFFDDL